MHSTTILTTTLWLTLAYTLATGAGLRLDPRTLGPDPIWLKPFKFGLSTGIYLATLLWAIRNLSPESQRSTLATLIALMAATATLFELAYIGYQASRGEASHFNLSTPWHRTMYSLMAFGALTLVTSGALTGGLLWWDTNSPLPLTLRRATAVAFLLSTILTIITALTMGGRLTHHVGTEPLNALRVPFFGWSLQVGDMRVPHFLATHLMQAGPLAAWLATRLLPPQLVPTVAFAMILAWSGLTLWVFRVVTLGHPWPDAASTLSQRLNASAPRETASSPATPTLHRK